MKLSRKSLLILAMASIAGAATPAFAAPDMQPVRQNNISYIQGGIGNGERQALEARRGDYNVHLTSANKDGQYVIPGKLTIRDQSGRILISTNNVDPIFYAKLPAGRYTVDAVNNGEHEIRKISVSADKSANLHMIW